MHKDAEVGEGLMCLRKSKDMGMTEWREQRARSRCCDQISMRDQSRDDF